MGGYDPVAYFIVAAPTKGKPEFSHVWDGERYLFSSAENRDRFAKEPARYAPQFPGYCAAALTRGEIVTPDPRNWIIIEGKLYLFGGPIGPEIFRKDPTLVEKSKANWVRLQKEKQ
jgi:YHS domain-containing protein